MSFRINPSIEKLFGSKTRAKVLGLLANSPEPKTGYALSKALDIGPPKVYPLLKALESAGFLESIVSGPGFKRYFLRDDNLRQFLRKKVRIAFEEDWFRPEMMRERRAALASAKRLTFKVPKGTARSPKGLANRVEFIRPREKDLALARIAKKRRRRGTVQSE